MIAFNNEQKEKSPRHHISSMTDVFSPLIGVRKLLRSSISYNTSVSLGDSFARIAPKGVQRWSEYLFDFPVAGFIREAPLLLIRIPRTASVSLSLQIYGRVSHVPHRSARFYRDADPAFFRRITSFAVVRDPWDRVQSAYNWLKVGGNALAAPNPASRRQMKGVETFDQFVSDLVLPSARSGHLADLDPTLRHQCDYVCDESGRVIVDHLFRFEEMQAVQDFLAAQGILTPPAHANITVRSGETDAMKRRTAEMIQEVYWKDIEAFNYGTDHLA